MRQSKRCARSLRSRVNKRQSKQEAEAALKRDESAWNALEAALKKAEAARSQGADLLSRHIAALQTLREQVSEGAAADLPALRAQYQAQDSVRKTREAARAVRYARWDTNEKLLVCLQEREKSMQTQEKTCLMLARLSDTANGELAGRQKLAFENYILALKRDESAWNALEAALKKAEAARSQGADLLSRHIAALQTLREQVSEGAAADLPALRAQYQAQDSMRKTREAARAVRYARWDTNEKLLVCLREREKSMQTQEKTCLMLARLSDTANGELAGRQKLAFENYILAFYFDQIIAAANERFHYMTSGQYRLVRRQEASGLRAQTGLELDVLDYYTGKQRSVRTANERFHYMTSGQYRLVRRQEASGLRAQTGLELDVLDYYTGKQRSVRTLSGGESFKASLSLALGLSDVIQRSAGGVEIDAMFIDEGFGSLDEESLDQASLDQAMNILTGLTDGQRLVGIISHVAELRSRLDKKIIVTRGKTGSSLRMEQ